jgi:hypothetical protein
MVAACGSTSIRTPASSAVPATGSAVGQISPSPTPNLAPCKGGVVSGARTINPTPNPASPNPGTGAIAGSLNFPSDILESQLVYAINVKGLAAGGAAVETVDGQGRYLIRNLAPGTYHVFSVARSYAFPPAACAAFGAIYSAAVACGLSVSCTDHRPLPVTVKSGLTTGGIDPQDWYSTPGDGSFTPAPPSIVPALSSVPSQGAGAGGAAAFFAQLRAYALLASDMSECPVNRACVAVGAEHDGQDAAYFTGVSGSNGVLLQCGTYVYLANGWHGMAWRCRSDHVFPAVGASGRVEIGIGAAPTDCANVRANPGLAGKVVGCIREGSTVTLDAGPSFVHDQGIDGLWWHVAGHGWMADNFLSWPPPG